MKDDLNLHEAFKIILSTENLKDYIREIAKCIYNNKMNFHDVLLKYKITNIVDIKEELLDLILQYINIILHDNKLTINELNNTNILKVNFKIKEGDFYKYRYDQIKEILLKQLSKIYRDDDKISFGESLYKVELQELFDLGYDQFLKFANIEDALALDRHANILDLDTVYFSPKKSKINEYDAVRLIPQDVKDKVWNRDGGKCVKCGGNERLDYDHIIPFSKGGSNTYRNIQLLCEKCNRKKSA
jgi:hypothetical protein